MRAVAVKVGLDMENSVLVGRNTGAKASCASQGLFDDLDDTFQLLVADMGEER